MRKVMCLLTFLSGASLVVAPSVKAQDDPLAPPPVPGILILNLSNYREAYIAQLLQPFRQAVGPDQILTAADIDRAKARDAAAQRARNLSVFFSADLDGDNKVTADEWQASNRFNQSSDTQFRQWD